MTRTNAQDLKEHARMKMDQTELPGDILKVSLSGDFDIAGASEVDLPFSVIAGNRDKVVVDFTNVGFLASIGIRVLVKSAKPIVSRGGKMVIVNPNEAARKVLASTGVDTLIPIVDDEAAAMAELS